MYNSIATVSLSGSLTAKLQAVAQAGYEGVELFEADVLADTHSPREIGRMIADLGLRCVTLQPFRDFEGLPEPARTAVFDRAERKFDLLQELGTDLLMVCSTTRADSSGEFKRIAEDLHELGVRAQKRGLRAAYEALAWGAHVHDHRDAWALVSAADHPNLGLVLDSFHSLARSVPTHSLHTIDPKRIFLVQLADAPLINMDILQWSRHLRCMPGQGGLPVVDYVRSLIEIGYDDVLSLEIFNDSFRASSTQVTALDGLRSLIAVVDEARRGLPGHADGPDLPPPIEVSRLDFIEFAASADDAGRLEELFGQFGFTRRGRHRSKAVSLWQQGEINLVLNSEPDGFAASHAATHGASVCALGVAVPDVAQAQARAEGLCMAAEVQPYGPGERTLPAIRSVGGSLIEFTAADVDPETAWGQDFVLEPKQKGAGLTRIDHLTQTVAHVDTLSWLLFYKSLFGLQPESQVDLADPVGLVQSQPLRSASDALTILLNSSASTRTLSARFIDRYFGAGVQQIALTSEDIFASADDLAARGIEFLAIPANYYDDLQARFGLDHDLVGRLKERQIIYDRDGEGEYLHFFTRAFERRFFFEIVERRGYRGFDPQGSIIRLAAQSRLKTLPV